MTDSVHSSDRSERLLESSRSIKLTNNRVTSWNLTSYFLAVGFGICMFVFLNAAQSYVLVDVLHYDKTQLGAASGNLSLADEIVSILLMGVWGILSDKIGRRFVYGIGFFLMGLGILLYPWARTVIPGSFSELFTSLMLFRVIFSIGASSTAAMVTAVLSDYAVNRRRSRLAGFVGLCSGIGAVFAVFLLLRLPTLIGGDAGHGIHSVRISFAIVSVLCLLLCFTVVAGLQKSNQVVIAEKSYGSLLLGGVKAVKNLEILLAYCGGFLARVDSIIPMVFIPLWVRTYYEENGLCGSEESEFQICYNGYIKASILTGVFNTSALFAAPLFGFLGEKTSILTSTLAAGVLGVIAFFGLLKTNNPDSGMMMLFMVIGGLAQIGMIVTSMALVSKNAPAGLRGSIAGVYSMVGSVGILLSTQVSGQLFDLWKESSSFLFPAVIHMGIVVFTVILLCKRNSQNRQSVEEVLIST